ncbi:hypothetical protein OMAG_002751 [Candidatus Omnitrophus magneticus]|uniref:Uncharacterized protein n=1 Tax=Candidatus Omnitrophus magneticus TaxID=1609969 RepID=A0A0F0CPM1_9BACT|nr:hypothetical protein OMAG_002751 [Candidatus Omnitrophus magneticus]
MYQDFLIPDNQLSRILARYSFHCNNDNTHFQTRLDRNVSLTLNNLFRHCNMCIYLLNSRSRHNHTLLILLLIPDLMDRCNPRSRSLSFALPHLSRHDNHTNIRLRRLYPRYLTLDNLFFHTPDSHNFRYNNDNTHCRMYPRYLKLLTLNNKLRHCNKYT